MGHYDNELIEINNQFIISEMSVISSQQFPTPRKYL